MQSKKNTKGSSSVHDKLWTPLFIAIVGVTLCCFMTSQGLNAGTSVYLDYLGESTTLAGAMAIAFSIAAALSRLLSGPLIDRGNRFAIMIVGAALLAGGSLIGALSTSWLILAAGRVLQGTGFAIATTAASTLAASVLPRARMGEGIGYYGLGQALAMSIGPAFALYLVATDPATNLFVGMGCVATIATIIAVVTLLGKDHASLPKTSALFEERARAREGSTPAPATKTSQQTFLSRFIEPGALPGALPQFIIAANVGFGIYFAGLYGTHLGIEGAGFFFSISAISMVLVRVSSHFFMDTVAPIKIFGVAVLAGLLTYGLLLVCPLWSPLFFAGGFFYGVSLGLALPLNQTVAVKNSPISRWGSANALFLFANDLGIGISAAIWGFVNATWGFPATLTCVLVCIAASYFVARAVYPKEA